MAKSMKVLKSMAVPLIPILLGAVVLVGCSKALKEARKSRPLPHLEGSEWGPNPAGEVEQFVAFKSGGEISGHSGCNNFFGEYRQEGDKLTIGALASTKKMCAGKMEAEAEFLQLLHDTRRIDSTHTVLILLDDKGDTLAEFKRRDWD